MISEQRHTPVPGPDEGTTEWLSLRKYDADRSEHQVVFGASTAAAVCGRSRYEQPLDVYLWCRDELPEREVGEVAVKRMRRGRKMQGLILDEYGDEYGVGVIEPNRMYFHPGLEFMVASPDGIVCPPDERPRYLVEAKATTPMMYGHMSAMEENKYGLEGTDLIPDEVLFQTQQQMEVMGMDRCDVVVFFGCFVMRVYPVERNDIIIEAITTAESEMAERIADGNPPEPNWTHPHTRRLISELCGYNSGARVQLTSEELELWITYQKLGHEIKQHEQDREECRNRILWAIGDAELGIFPMGEKELRRVQCRELTYTAADVAKVQDKVGGVKRKAYERLLERKVKN